MTMQYKSPDGGELPWDEASDELRSEWEDEYEEAVDAGERDEIEFPAVWEDRFDREEAREVVAYNIELIDSNVQAGSGSLPIENIESVALVFSNKTVKPTKISKLFRTSSIPIIGYIKGNKFHIDLKAIPDNQISLLINTVKNCL